MVKFAEIGGAADLVDEGIYQGALVGYVDEGLQLSQFGASKQALLTFELADTIGTDGKPSLVFKRLFNVSVRSKNFVAVIRALSNAHQLADVEIHDLLGKWAAITVKHNTNAEGSTFANIEVSPLTGKAPKNPPKSQLIYFSMHPSEYDPKVLDSLSERQSKKIRDSQTYKDLLADRAAIAGKPPKKTAAAAIINDDIPFDKA